MLLTIGVITLTKIFQLHGLELVCLEVHVYVISIGVLCTQALRARRASHVLKWGRKLASHTVGSL